MNKWMGSVDQQAVHANKPPPPPPSLPKPQQRKSKIMERIKRAKDGRASGAGSVTVVPPAHELTRA